MRAGKRFANFAASGRRGAALQPHAHRAHCLLGLVDDHAEDAALQQVGPRRFNLASPLPCTREGLRLPKALRMVAAISRCASRRAM